MYPIDLTGHNAVIFGVANDRSIAWAIARALAAAGARIALTYQNDRLKSRVARLADTLDNALILPCDAADDAQIAAVFARLQDEMGGALSTLVHSIAFANRAGSGRPPGRYGARRLPGGAGNQRLYPAAYAAPRRPADDRRRQRHRHDLPRRQPRLSRPTM